jgi:hypothetical protein
VIDCSYMLMPALFSFNCGSCQRAPTLSTNLPTRNKLDSYVDKTTLVLVGTATIKRQQGLNKAGQHDHVACLKLRARNLFIWLKQQKSANVAGGYWMKRKSW